VNVHLRAGLPNVLLPLLALGLVGCNKDEITWVAFNAPDQTLEVDVLPEGSPVGDPVSIDLLSNLGQTKVGTATVDPGSGPVGTEHVLTVLVLEDYQDRVGRASVEVKSEAVSDLNGDGKDDARQNDGYDLRQDSANPGLFAITLESLGTADEARTDEWTVHLWTPQELTDGTTAATTTGTTQ
jgi:hypothetical protein